jgi:pyruvate formate lyase activating enzyme
MEASYYTKLDNHNVQCELCPHNCIIQNNKSGICKVRTNDSGILLTKNYGKISSIGFDSIEKKPLYHFYPGSDVLSIGSLGCNLKCQFCQNWEISQTNVEDFSRESKLYTSEQITELALSRKNNIGIAYTYNEPIVFYEFMLSTAKLSKQSGLKNVMISNGYINQKPLQELLPYIDAFNIDLKSFSENFYREYTKSKLEPIKQTLKTIASAHKYLEITNLVIPTLNDDSTEFEEMIKWIRDNLGDEIVYHISRYFPTYKLKIDATLIDKMISLAEIASKYLKYVYLGNILLEEGSNTYCPKCNELVIKRSGYLSKLVSVTSKGECMKCKTQILKHVNYEN